MIDVEDHRNGINLPRGSIHGIPVYGIGVQYSTVVPLLACLVATHSQERPPSLIWPEFFYITLYYYTAMNAFASETSHQWSSPKCDHVSWQILTGHAACAGWLYSCY